MFGIGATVRYDSDLGYNCDTLFIVLAANITNNSIFYTIQNLNEPKDIHYNIEDFFLVKVND